MAIIHLLGCHSSRGSTELRIGVDSPARSGRRAFVAVEPASGLLNRSDQELLALCSGIFSYEGIVRGRRTNDASIDTLVIHVDQDSRFLDATAQEALERILSFTIGSCPRIKVVSHRNPRSDVAVNEGPPAGSISLFSGGTDSLSGVTVAKGALGPTLALHVSHSASMANRVGLISESVLKPQGINTQTIRVQPRSGPQQTRGLLYLAAAAVFARATGTDHVMIAESGPTMILPRVSPLDELTVTTHPFLLAEVRALAERICDRQFAVHLPFSGLTKAESLAACELRQAIPVTNSCITTRWANAPVSHCGLCFGCIVRRLSAAVAGVEDARYLWDPILNRPALAGRSWTRDRRITPERFAEFQRLLLFCREVLTGSLSTVVQEDLRFLRREALMRRFALDMLAGVHVLIGASPGRSNRWVSAFMEECQMEGVAGPSGLRDRIREVRAVSWQPDLTRVV